MAVNTRRSGEGEEELPQWIGAARRIASDRSYAAQILI